MNSPDSSEIHGHAVLQMMDESALTYSRETLLTAIHARFGEDARFEICSGSGMDAAALIEALEAKGKFMGPEDAFRFDPSALCQH